MIILKIIMTLMWTSISLIFGWSAFYSFRDDGFRFMPRIFEIFGGVLLMSACLLFAYLSIGVWFADI